MEPLAVRRDFGFAVEPFPALGDVARLRRIVDDEELVTGHRHAREAEHLHRDRRAGLLHDLAALVEQRAHTTGEQAADEVLSDLECPVLHEHTRHRTLARVELRLDDRADRIAIRVGLEVEELGLQQDLVEQLRDAGALLRRNRRRQRLAAEHLEHDAVRKQVLHDALRVRVRQVRLVDGDDDRDAGVLRVRNGLDRLRHHGVVGRDDEDDDIGHLRAAGAHGGERLVARGVEEGDPLPVRQRDVVGADVLRDPARLAGDDVGAPDEVEEGRLAVVDVAHDGHDRRPRHQLLRRVRHLLGPHVGRVLLLAHRLEPEFAGDQLDLVEIESLVDGHHQAEVLERERDDLRGRHLEDGSEFGDGDELVDADGLPFALLRRHACRLEFLAGILGPAHRAAPGGAAHGGHGAPDVGADFTLVDRATLALLAALRGGARSRAGALGRRTATLPLVAPRGNADPTGRCR